jgi:plastocyanin
MESRFRARAIAVSALGLTVVLLGCFSEHGDVASVEGTCNVPVDEGVAGSTVIVIDRFTFGPTEVSVRTGDRITWLNCDLESHTSTADGGEWASPLLAPGDAFTQSFPTPGEFSYHCEPHPFMVGRVVVQ